METITAYCKNLSRYLNGSELTGRRAFIESFVREIVARPGGAVVRYLVPMPDDGPIRRRDSEEVEAPEPSTVKSGGRLCSCKRITSAAQPDPRKELLRSAGLSITEQLPHHSCRYPPEVCRPDERTAFPAGAVVNGHFHQPYSLP